MPESFLITTSKTFVWSVRVLVLIFAHQNNKVGDVGAGEQYTWATFCVFPGAVLKGCEIPGYLG